MSKAKNLPDRFDTPGNDRGLLVHYIRYGLATIQTEGLRYFLKRLWGLIAGQMGHLYRLVYLRLASPPDSRLITIQDIEIEQPSEPGQQPQALTIPTELINATLPGEKGVSPHDALVIQGITAHNQHLAERNALIQEGRENFAYRSLLFLAPIGVRSGGANLIFLAARAMQRMGVEVKILNQNIHRAWFEKTYANMNIPVIFADMDEVPLKAAGFDAVIATSNPTVGWMAELAEKHPILALGYFIQGYEPEVYAPDSHEYRKASASYTLYPNLIRMVTTGWIAEQIKIHHQVQSVLVGACLDTDLFRPRRCNNPTWPDRPLRITAMIRPSTPWRNPRMTMQVLQKISAEYRSKSETRLFGCDFAEPGFASLPKDFPWQLAGELRPAQMANLLNEADIFVDFSVSQALGLTALESMASGLAVIVPRRGGSDMYAKDEENCLAVDTTNEQECFQSLQRLIEEDTLRSKLQSNAVSTAAKFYPERLALNILNAVFSGVGDGPTRKQE